MYRKLTGVLFMIGCLWLSTLPAFGSPTPRLENRWLAIEVKPRATAVEYSYHLADRWITAGTLVPIGKTDEAIRSIAATQALNKTLIVTCTTAGGASRVLLLTLRTDAPLVEIRPGPGAQQVRIQWHKSPFGILPDLRASDLVFDARKAKGPSVYLPREHLFLNLIDEGNAMVVVLWPSVRQQVRLTAEKNMFTGIEANFANANPVFLGFLAAPGIWHVENTNDLSDVEEKVLAWKPPFSAHWTVDYPRTDGLTDSYGSGVNKGDSFEVPGLAVINQASHSTWISPRNSFLYPFYFEGQKAWVRIPKFSGSDFIRDITYRPNAPVLIYPFERTPDTPADIQTPRDLMRLAFELTTQADLYTRIKVRPTPRWTLAATCAVTDQVEKAFDAGEEVKRRDELAHCIASMDMFVLSIRERIEEYLVWSKDTREYIADKAKAHPELKDLSADLIDQVSLLDRQYARVKNGIKTPAETQTLSRQFLQLIDSRDPDKVEKVKALGRRIRTVGGGQDWLCAESRQILSEIRQRAGLRMAAEPDETRRALLQEIRDRIFEFTPITFYHELGIEGSRRDN